MFHACHADVETCHWSPLTIPSLYLPVQLATINFFMTFLATFALAALLPTIRENLSLTRTEIGVGGGQLSDAACYLLGVASLRYLPPHQTNAGVTAVVGAVFGRMFMGGVLDTLGESWL